MRYDTIGVGLQTRGTGLAGTAAEVDRRDRAHAAGPVVGHGLQDLLAGVHDEGPVLHDRLTDGAAAQDEHVERGRPPVLTRAAPHADRPPRAPHRALARA